MHSFLLRTSILAGPSPPKSPAPLRKLVWTGWNRYFSLTDHILLHSFDLVCRVWSFCKTINCIIPKMNDWRCHFELAWDAYFSSAGVDFSRPKSPPLAGPNHQPSLRGLIWPGLNRHFSLADFILIRSFDPVRRVWAFCNPINWIVLKKNIWKCHFELAWDSHFLQRMSISAGPNHNFQPARIGNPPWGGWFDPVQVASYYNWRCHFDLTWDAHFSSADVDFSWPKSPSVAGPNHPPPLAK